MKCKDCKWFDNTVPVSTVKGNDKHKFAEDYIGMCSNLCRIKMMNDTCPQFEKKEETENE